MTLPAEFTDSTTNFSLPFLFAAQAQREFYINESLAKCDILMHTSIEEELNSPPESPQDGECWIVSNSPTGEWSGKETMLAGRQAGEWIYIVPQKGMRIYDRSTQNFLLFTNIWERVTSPTTPSNGSIQDAELRTAFQNLIACLQQTGILPVV